MNVANGILIILLSNLILLETLVETFIRWLMNLLARDLNWICQLSVGGMIWYGRKGSGIFY